MSYNSDEDTPPPPEDSDDEVVRQINKKKRARAAAADESDEDADVYADNKSKKTKPKKKRAKKKFDVASFFLEQAEEGDDEEDVDDENHPIQEVILGEDEQAARDAVERRHRAAKERMEMPAEDLAEEYERRHKEQARRQKMQGQIYGVTDSGVMGRGGSSAVMQQSLLPSINDPGIFKVKCVPGKEVLLVRSILLKAIASKMRGTPIRIKSVFTNSSKGLLYIEALAEPYAREAILGLRGLYNSTLSRVPVMEMTTLLSLTVTKRPLKIGQWVRLKRGVLKGDLARVVSITEGGAKALIQAVPRPDYTARKDELGTKVGRARPTQRMFSPEEAMSSEAQVIRKVLPADRAGRTYDFWNNEYHREGYLYKEVSVETYIETENIRPRLEELSLFKPNKREGDRYDDQDDRDGEGDGEDEHQSLESRSLMRDIVDQLKDLGEDEAKSNVMQFVTGDVVQVVGGELKNLIGRIISINEMIRSVTLAPFNSVLKSEIVIEVDLLVKYIVAGAHIKVVAGQHMGLTGRVVSVNSIDGDHIAAILTDGMNTEIQCNVGHLQTSSEVTTGHGHLMGYELYDLVALHNNESAVVVAVGSEKLVVVTISDERKDLLPPELLGKRNVQSGRASAFDSVQSSVHTGDTVNVVSGTHNKRSGTIKHIMKGTLWIHSNTYLKNSGIFAVRARYCLVVGAKANGMGLGLGGGSGSTFASTASTTAGTKVAAIQGPNYKIAKDVNVGKTVRITRGPYKGSLADVIDTTPTHYSVELLSKMRKIMIEKEKVVLVGDKAGVLDPEKRNQRTIHSHSEGLSDLSSETPRNLSNQTPAFNGSETPMGAGSYTPGGRMDDGGDSWKMSANDILPSDYGNNDRDRDRNSDRSNSNTPAWSGSGGSGSGGRRDEYSDYTPSSAYSPAVSVGSMGSYNNHSNGQYQYDTPSSFVFAVGMVVTVKDGPSTGRQAVVQLNELNDEFVYGRMLDNQSNRLEADNIRFKPSALALAEPHIRCHVMVTAGRHKGMKGIIKTIVKNDVILEPIQGGKTGELFKISSVAWMHR